MNYAVSYKINGLPNHNNIKGIYLTLNSFISGNNTNLGYTGLILVN